MKTDDEIDWTTPAAKRLMERDLIHHDRPPDTPDPVDHEVTKVLPAPPGPVVASMGLPWHPAPKAIADDLRAAADRVSDQCAKALSLARELAANGYPGSTLGDGGSRGTDSTSSTERAAGLGGRPEDKPRQNEWAGVDRKLAAALAAASRASKNLDALIQNICHHAPDLDRVPVGTGECQACGRFCRPDAKHAGNRLRSGLCPTDYRAYLRAGQPERSAWIHQRRGDLTDDDGVLHTPEPDHDIDLSSMELSP